MKPDTAESGTNHPYKKSLKVGDIIEVNDEHELFKVTRISSSGRVYAISTEGSKIEISRFEIRFNHKNNINF